MRLEQTLEDAKKLFMVKYPEDVYSGIFQMIREQQQSGAAFGLREGDRMPDFTLPSASGVPVNLREQLARGPVVLVFYRGGWCPYCNIQLRAYQRILPDIEALGAQLIAISPQSPDNALSQQEKEELRFHVLSDADGRAAASCNLLFDVPPYVQDIMTNQFKLSLLEYNAADRWILPVPSTFIIDRSGVVRFAYVNPDFMQRLDPQQILEQLRGLTRP